jgi:predicted negative regulator of RcsB-dependent stress response
MTRTGVAARPAPDFDERADSFLTWSQLHARQLGIAAIVIVVVALGAWLYAHSRQVRSVTASTQLATAEQAMSAGNAALAQSDLERLIKRYPGTRAGKEGRLLLAQVLYQKGQYAQGIAQLTELTTSDERAIAANAENLIGAGYEEMQKWADAATHYERAANTTPYPAYKDGFLANAARAYTEAGKTDEAKRIWQSLASDPSSPSAAEARVRLGQLEAKPVSKG